MQFKRQRVDVFRRKNEKRLAEDDRSGDLIGRDGDFLKRGAFRGVACGQFP